jgi:acetyl esterase/lipase
MPPMPARTALMIGKLFFPLIIFLSICSSNASDSVLLWPSMPPGESRLIKLAPETTKAGDRLVGGKLVTRISNVSEPSITLYKPSARTDTGTAVVVCPGGGYGILAIDLEGTEVCQWLNSIGVTGVLLKYRVPPQRGIPPYVAPLQDVQRALGLVRFHAGEWHINPKRIGIFGFSAGGDLSALASTRFEQRTYAAVDESDQFSCRPDFAMLIYPFHLVRKEGPDLASELSVSSNTPPTFLIQTEDDPVHVENSVFYYLALKQAKVPAEMHLFAKGGHGYGLRKSGYPVTSWSKLAEEWMRGLGVLN